MTTLDPKRTKFTESFPTQPLDNLAPGWQTEPALQVLKLRSSEQRLFAKTPEPSIPQLLARWRETPAEWDYVEWEAFAWKPEEHCQTRSTRGAGLATLARRLITLEKAKMRRANPIIFSGRRGYPKKGMASRV